MDFAAVSAAAVLCEGLVEYTLANVLSKKQLMWGTLIVGVLVAFGFNVDLTAQLGLKAIAPWVGHLATGLLLARGSNYLNDLVTRVRGGSSSPTEGL